MFKRFQMSIFLAAGLLAVFFAAGSLADEYPEGTQSVPSEMTRLLHKDTTAFVYIASPLTFSDSLNELYSVATPGGDSGGLFRKLLRPKSHLGSLVLTKNEIMVDNPIGIGTWATEEDDNAPYVVIFRVQGATPKTVMAKGKGRRLMFLEGTDWIAVTNAPASWSPAAENAPTPAIVENMLPGQCVMSFDQSAWLGTASHKSIDESIKKQLKDSVDETMQAALLDAWDDWAYGFKRWDCSANAADGDLVLQARCQLTADSKYASIHGTSELISLGNRLPGKLPFQSIVTTSCMTWVSKFMKPFIVAQAGKDKVLADTLLGDLSALLATQTVGNGTAMGISEYGIDLAQVFQVEDAPTTLGLIDTYIDDINGAKAGVHFKRMPVLIGSDSSRLYEVTFDKAEMKKANPATRFLTDSAVLQLLDAPGDDTFYVRVISNGNWMAVVAGEPKLLGRMRRALGQPSAFNPSLDRIASGTKGDLVMAMSFDLRSFFIGAQQYMHAHPKEVDQKGRKLEELSEIKVESGPPAVMSASVASQGDDVLMFNVFFDVRQIASFCYELMGKVEAAARAQERVKQAEEAKKQDKK